MARTISNVLTGVGRLYVKSPWDEAYAEWSTTQKQAGSYSVKLFKGNTGNAHSTHFQMVPPTGITLANWTTGIAASQYSFYHWLEAITANWVQVEFRFEDPNSDAWVEITWMGLQNALGTAAWVQQAIADADTGGYGGVGEAGASFFNFGPLTAMSAMESAITAEGVVTDASDWILERVRLELWAPSPERTCYVDTIEINGVTYAIEPGGSAPAMSLDSGYVEVGYTEDGITIEYTADTADIEVEEETFPIERPITKETVAITANLAEASLANLHYAMGGGVISGSILTMGGGVQKELVLKFTGTNPAGFTRTIHIAKATAVGATASPYKKGEKTVVPVTFQALKGEGPPVLIVDNAA